MSVEQHRGVGAVVPAHVGSPWDNPKSDQALQVKHLEQAKIAGAGIIDGGDFFCAMQGTGDPRGNKSDIRPEHNNANYLDSLVETASDWIQDGISTSS